jgi:MSHA biogenesis protein MshE
MVGEMRDQETVEIGLRGALTGHLVLSTLHTNDAISSAIRLIDMGAPGYLVASSLKGIVAQRLVRKLCDRCAIESTPDDEHSVWLSQIDEALAKHSFKDAGGCQSCNYTGYKGRIGVFELLEMNEAMMNALKNADTAEFSKQAHLSDGYRPLALAALDYAKAGKTSLDEVMRLVESVSEVKTLPVPNSASDPLPHTASAGPKPPKSSGLSLEDAD